MIDNTRTRHSVLDLVTNVLLMRKSVSFLMHTGLFFEWGKRQKTFSL